jgi:GNAT superfamily N-acetyltransferase
MTMVPLRAAHARAGFRCGDAALDRYFKSQAGRDAVRGLAAVFVLVLPDAKLAGYYTLAPATVFLPDLLAGGERKTSRYPPMPAARLSRLAVDLRHRGQGYGRHMLADALARVRRSGYESVAVVAEAEEEAGQEFYRHAGFAAFPDRPDRLFRPMAGLG